jgi:hypothetical protein
LNSQHDKKILKSAGKELARIHDKIYPGQTYFLEAREQKSKNPNVVATTYGATAKVNGRRIKGFSVSLRPNFFEMSKADREKVLQHEVQQHMRKPGQASRHHAVGIEAGKIANPKHSRSKLIEDIHI